MVKKQFQNKMLQAFYRPKKNRLIPRAAVEGIEEFSKELDKKIDHFLGKKKKKE